MTDPRRAAGLTGMLALAGALVVLKGAGTTGASTSALHPGHRAVAAHATTPFRASGSFTGQTVDTPYGPVQVRLQLQAGRIVDVTALQTPDSAGYSRQLARYAVPLLRSEVLRAQSADIDTISGATYTSEGYAQSAQAALDRAHGA